MNRWVSYTFLLFTALFMYTLSYSQNRLNVVGSVFDNNGNLSEVDILVNSDTIHKFSSDANGRFSFHLDFNGYYLVSFKKKGYGSKRVAINTNLPEVQKSRKQQLISMNLELIDKASENTSDTLGEIKYSLVTKEFTYESKYDKNAFLNIQVFGRDYYDYPLADEGDEDSGNNLRADTETDFYDKDILKRKQNAYKSIVDKRKKFLGSKVEEYKFEELELVDNKNQVLQPDTIINQYSHHRMDVLEILISSKKFVRVYHRVKHDWGAVFFFRNYRSITKTLFNLETQFDQKNTDEELSEAF
ncbi:MAG: carboxypeptidase-like regulatory domain-containing protein [Bacteroidales bacterium]